MLREVLDSLQTKERTTDRQSDIIAVKVITH